MEAINRRQKHKLFERIRVFYDGDLRGKTFALWGLAFKPNTDDMRDAPSRELMEALWRHGAQVRAYDPEAMQETQRLYGHDERLSLMGTPRRPWEAPMRWSSAPSGSNSRHRISSCSRSA